jgi:hypothetical protein
MAARGCVFEVWRSGRTLAQVTVAYAVVMADDAVRFEEAVLAQAPPGAVVVGSSISPDGRYGVALTILPSASDYPMDDLFERVDDDWTDFSGGSGSGVCWTSLGSSSDRGVLRFADEAPSGATAARVAYESNEYRVPVREGWFFFAAWDTAYADDPRVVGFE